MIYKSQYSQYIDHLILQDPQKALENRVITIKITDTYFIGLYGPTHSNILSNKENFTTQYKEILRIIQEQIISDKIIVGGDLNVHIKTSDSTNNRIDNFFIEWMEENNFLDAIYLNPSLKRIPTYVKDPAKSIIDRFLIKDTIDATNIQYLPKDNYVTSDHLPIMISINLKDINLIDPPQSSFRTKRSFKKFEKNKERFNQEITDKWNRLKGQIPSNHPENEASPQHLELFTKILNDSANNYTKITHFKQDAIDKDIKRITNKLNLLSNIQTNLHQIQIPTDTLRIQMIEANLSPELLDKPIEIINKTIGNQKTKLLHAKHEQERNLKNLTINKWRKDINKATERQDTKKLYKFLKSKTPQTPFQSILIQENGNSYISQDPILVKEKARLTFQEKFNNTITTDTDPPYWFNYIQKLQNYSNSDDLTKIITIEELQETTKYLATDKSPGPDNLENEIFRNLNQHNLKTVLTFLNHCITTRTIYQSWKKGYTSLIYKKGNQHDPNNYRPITLLSCFYKLYSRIITQRLTKIIREENLLTNSQNGFLEGKSTKTCLFDALALLEDASINKTDLYTCYIDFANAFDSVPHEGIKNTLMKMGFNSNVVEIILSLITSRTTQIITKYGLSDPVYINRGVPQGDVISPLLFIIFLNPLLAQIEKTEIGKAMGNRTKFEGLVLAFADDIKLSASTLEDLQSMIDTITHFIEHNGMTLNLGPNKTVFQYMRKRDWETAKPVKHTGELRYRKEKIDSNHFKDNYHLYYKDTPIPQILPHEPYKYLGVPITMLLQWKYARRAIMEKITTRAHTLSYIPINGPTLANAINSMIISVITYGGTFITFKNKHLNQLKSLTRQIFLIQNKCKRAANKYTPFVDRNKGGCGEFDVKKEIHNIRILDFVRYINGNNKLSPMYLSLFSFPQNIKDKTTIFDENNFYFFLADPNKACVLKSKYNRSNYFLPKLIKSTVETKVAIKENNLFHKESLEEILKFLREGKQPILAPNIITSGITDLRELPYRELSAYSTNNIQEYNNLKKTLLSKPDEQKLQKKIRKRKERLRENRNLNRKGEVTNNDSLIQQYLESECKLKSLRDKLRKIRKEHKKKILNYAHAFLNNCNTSNQQEKNTIFLEATEDSKQKIKQSQIIMHRVKHNKVRPTILNERDSNRTGKVPKKSIDSYLTIMEKNVLKKEEEKNKLISQHKTYLSEYLIQNHRTDLLQTLNPTLIREPDISLWKLLVQNSIDDNQIIIGIDGSNSNGKTAYALKMVKSNSSIKITKSDENDPSFFIKTKYILQESKQIGEYGSCYIAELIALLRTLELISPFSFDTVIVGDNQALINMVNFFLTKPSKPIKKQNKYKYLLKKLHHLVTSYQGKLTALFINSHLYDDEANPSKIPTLNLINKDVDYLANRECHSNTPQFQTNFYQVNSNPDKFYMEIKGNLINSTKEIRKEQRSEQIKITKEKIKSKRILRYIDCFNNKISNSFLLGARKELTRFRYKATNDLLNTSRDTKRVLIQSKYPENIISEKCPFCNDKEDTFEHRCFCNSSVSQKLRERRKAALLMLTNTLQKHFNINILPFLEKYTDLTYLPNNLNHLTQLEQNNLIKFYLGKRNSKIHQEMKNLFQSTSDIPFNINQLNRSLLYILKTSWDESTTITFQIRSNIFTNIKNNEQYLSVQDIINLTTDDACRRKHKMNKIYQKDEDYFNKITYLPEQETEELQGPNHITTYLNDLHLKVQTFSNNSFGLGISPEPSENIT
ncbi:MAG: reverse transcriptase family protein [Nanoarchaeota archaeon]